MSKALKKRGFRFVGSTICYAFMQAAGMVNDHLVDCFRHGEFARRMQRWRVRVSDIDDDIGGIPSARNPPGYHGKKKMPCYRIVVID